MGCFLYYGILLVTALLGTVGASACSVLDTEFYVSWAADHVKFLNGGQELHLTLDQASGSGFASKNKYLFGNINMQIKFVPGDSAGTVTEFYVPLFVPFIILTLIAISKTKSSSAMTAKPCYGFILQLSSQGSNHDELDFEFLGNKSGEPYVLQTNVYASGKGDREQRIYLWFDPATEFHTYGVIWNTAYILFMVDEVPIRIFMNNKALGVPYPERQAMGVLSSIWNGDSWATQGGLVKIDWSHAPFVAAYRNFQSYEAVASSMEGSDESEPLTPGQKNKLDWVKRNYMIYDYCEDKQRYPVPPPDCFINL